MNTGAAMLAPSRKRPLPLFLVLAVIVLFFLFHRRDRIRLEWTSRVSPNVNVPANRTLGFGAVAVVSREGSARRHSLLQAANVTDIDLTIPQQPQWTENDVEKFRGGMEDGAHKGSILAWLGHRNALQWFLNSTFETVLILEDDVDWDIHLRSTQIPLAASATRTALPPKPPVNPFARQGVNQVRYWGDHGAWDLIYLGHCGDYFNFVWDVTNPETPLNLEDIAHVVYTDPTRPARVDLHPYTGRLFDALHLPMRTRMFHRSNWPLCSFGYAVTRPAAERLLDDLAPAKFTEAGPRAFDVALLHACNKGSRTPSSTPSDNPIPYPDPALRHKYASPGLRCWTLNSELFHHMPGESLIAKVGVESGLQRSGVPPVDAAGQEQIANRNETSNIGCGFWKGAFDFDEGDMSRLQFLQEEVGRKGRCLKSGRESE